MDLLSPRKKGNLGEDLLSGLQNPALCDVTLIGSDEGRVPAIRSILAARSKVLERMLVGGFQEASSNEVKMAYPAPVLRALVHFCCTDSIPDLDQMGDDEFKVARMAIALCAAADYYELEALLSAAEASLDAWAFKNACGACAMLDESLKHSSLTNARSTALTIIHTFPYQPLLSKANKSGVAGVTSLRQESLLLLLEDNGLVPHAKTMFLAIQVWAEATANDSNGSEDMEVENSLEFAKSCARKLELRFIPPTDLLTIVRDSGLVESERILEVMAKQAKQEGALYVYDSNIPGVNGMYEQTGPRDGATLGTYEKRGEFDGNDVTFTLIAWIYPGFSQGYALYAPRKGASRMLDSLRENLCLYKSMRDPSDTSAMDQIVLKAASGDAPQSERAMLCFPPRLTATTEQF